MASPDVSPSAVVLASPDAPPSVVLASPDAPPSVAVASPDAPPSVVTSPDAPPSVAVASPGVVLAVGSLGTGWSDAAAGSQGCVVWEDVQRPFRRASLRSSERNVLN